MFVLSAGHNPTDKGAHKFDDPSFNEYDQACKWVKLLSSYLTDKGIGVIQVPTGTLSSKIKFINSLTDNIKLAIEIHFNSAHNIKAEGSETLYCPGSVKGLHYASRVQKVLSKHFKPDRGFKEGWYRMDRPGHKDYAGDVDGDEQMDAFLGKTKPVSLILEPEFIHNSGSIINKMDECCMDLAELMHEIATTG